MEMWKGWRGFSGIPFITISTSWIQTNRPKNVTFSAEVVGPSS